MKRAFWLAAAVLIVGSAGSVANAAIVHRYSFNGNVNDSVGTANATLVNGASTDATSLITPGGGSGSAGTSPAAQLPIAAVAGVTGDFAVETYFTAATTSAGFATLFNFSDATNTTYFIATPNRNNTTGVSSIAVKVNNGTETVVQGANLNNNAQHQFLASYNKTAGSVTLYVDGLLAGGPTVVANGTVLDLSLLTNREGVNGLAGFGDAALTGSTNDFRIYNQQITATQALQLNAVGANATNAQINGIIPEPAPLGLLGLGAIGLMGRRRRRV